LIKFTIQQTGSVMIVVVKRQGMVTIAGIQASQPAIVSLQFGASHSDFRAASAAC
jgi:hypothetical protein